MVMHEDLRGSARVRGVFDALATHLEAYAAPAKKGALVRARARQAE
jgi:hypothetical protein